MIHVRAVRRYALTVAAYTIRSWLEGRHDRTTRAYIDHTRRTGNGAGRTTRAYREQDIDE